MKEIQRTVEANEYHYVECGLPNVWLRNGFEKKQTPYGEGVSIFRHRGIAPLHFPYVVRQARAIDRAGVQVSCGGELDFFPKNDR